MDNQALRKRLSTFKSSKGSLTRVTDDVLFEVIRTWEAWPSSSTELARELGVSVKQISFLIRKAKAAHREGRFPQEEFKEVKVESTPQEVGLDCKGGIVMKWEKGRVIKFSKVDQLVDFLKKVA